MLVQYAWPCVKPALQETELYLILYNLQVTGSFVNKSLSQEQFVLEMEGDILNYVNRI